MIVSLVSANGIGQELMLSKGPSAENIVYERKMLLQSRVGVENCDHKTGSNLRRPNTALLPQASRTLIVSESHDQRGVGVAKSVGLVDGKRKFIDLVNGVRSGRQRQLASDERLPWPARSYHEGITSNVNCATTKLINPADSSKGSARKDARRRTHSAPAVALPGEQVEARDCLPGPARGIRRNGHTLPSCVLSKSAPSHVLRALTAHARANRSKSGKATRDNKIYIAIATWNMYI